jgi:hypothetical protein
MKIKSFLLSLSLAGAFVASSHGATIIEAHSSGFLTDNFEVVEGNALQSGVSSAPGRQATNSVYASEAATWVFSFTPGTDLDNWTPEAGTALTNATHGGGETATGLTQDDLLAGGTGEYRIFATWPWSTNVSNPTTITLTDSLGVELYTRTMNQNVGPTWSGVAGGEGTGFVNGWGLLTTTLLTAGETYTLSFTSEAGAVSQRVQGVMFEPYAIPEPSTYAAIFGGLALLVAAGRRFRARRS